MLGLCALSKCFSVLVILHLSTSRQSEGLQGYLRSNKENHAEFVEHFHSVLNIPLMASFKVYDSMACVLQCIRNTLCYSVNFAVDSDDQGHACDLFPSDKYYFRYKFNRSYSYHHYSIAVGII